uniref:PABC domain-containing protein n=1 Tax=viral metagenome TaxID=1070528 RepID=A0A6C0B5Z6_9ZZZZ
MSQTEQLVDYVQTVAEQKATLRELLYNIVVAKYPKLATEITDKFIEFDVPHVMQLIEDPDSIDEAIEQYDEFYVEVYNKDGFYAQSIAAQKDQIEDLLYNVVVDKYPTHVNQIMDVLMEFTVPHIIQLIECPDLIDEAVEQFDEFQGIVVSN